MANEAKKYGVTVDEISVPPGTTYFKCVRVRHLPPEENVGKHHLFVDVWRKDGSRMNQAKLELLNNGSFRGIITIDKPTNEPGTNTQMHMGDTLSVRVVSPPFSSDQVHGMHTRHEDEGTGNTRGHHSFHVEFQETVKGEENPKPIPEPKPDPEPKPEPKPDPEQSWRSEFTERELKEIDFCILYQKNFAHGTVGHNEKLIIARMAWLLDRTKGQ